MNAGERANLGALLRDRAERCWADVAGHASVCRQPQLTPEGVDRLLEYLETLLLWRSRISLVATGAPRELVQRHIVDGLAILPFVPEGARVADIGSGAGLPGLVCAIVAPDLEVDLIEPRRKRASFLREAAGRTGARNARIIERVAEDVDRADSNRWTLAVARAFASLEEFLDLLDFVREERLLPRVIAMKGPQGRGEAAAVESTWGPATTVSYDLGDRIERLLLIYDKPRRRFT